jgi:hypothetical protein
MYITHISTPKLRAARDGWMDRLHGKENDSLKYIIIIIIIIPTITITITIIIIFTLPAQAGLWAA